MKRFGICGFCLFLASLGNGCGSGKESVQGTVSYDDQPVKSGIITFVSAEGPLVREGAVITDGRFIAQMPPGKYKIELHAQKIKGTEKRKGFDGKSEELTITEELFPSKYNTATELSEVIKPGITNTITLNLKSKK